MGSCHATPGTESYRQCLAQALLTSPELALQRSTCFPVETPQASRPELVTLFHLCRLLNFLKACVDAQPVKTGAVAWETLTPVPDFLPPLPAADLLYHVPRKLTPPEIGAWLLRALFQTGECLGLPLVRRSAGQVTYRVYAEAAACLDVAAGGAYNIQDNVPLRPCLVCLWEMHYLGAPPYSACYPGVSWRCALS